MAKSENSSVWISLKPLDAKEASQEFRTTFDVSVESARQEGLPWLEYSQQVVRVAMIVCRGAHFHLTARRLMVDEELRLQHEHEAVAHAIKQVVRGMHPDRKHLQVQVRCNNRSNDGDRSDWEASLWWNYRKQYDQLHFMLSYV